MAVHLVQNVPRFPLPVKYLEFLITTPLKDVLKRARLPQFKTLILPPVDYPFSDSLSRR